jgi:aerobic-type carbon monoxide dehydrogenase small subunit (CoxS/CutS family)
MARDERVEEVVLDVNGQRHTLTVEGRRTLAETLRDDLGLTGTKESCGMGNCGACTVLIDDDAVYSCLVLTAECDAGPGRPSRIETIEHLADGQAMHPLQQAFVDCDALQCGMCTPGQILSLEALRRAVPQPRRCQIETAIQGNLCRCGAYRHILQAAVQALGSRP